MDHPLRAECCAHSQACMCDKGKIPNEYPFSFLAHLLLEIKETGITQRVQWFLNGSSFSVHKGRTPKHTQKAHTNSSTLDTLLSIHWSDLFKHSSRRQKGWRAGRLMNARVWATSKCLCCPHVAFCSQESPIKPLAPRPSLLSSVYLTLSLFLLPKLDACIKTTTVFRWFTDQGSTERNASSFLSLLNWYIQNITFKRNRSARRREKVGTPNLILSGTEL